MKIEIFPSRANGKMCAPPSKSMGHRLLISAGLSSGESVIHGIAPSEDMYATMDCLRALGANIKYENETVYIKGINISEIPDGAYLPCRECGSTLRFFVPIALLSGNRMTFGGSERLLSRPMEVYRGLCDEYLLGDNTLTVKGKLSERAYKVRGDVSSQFISGLLFALPLCGGGRIELTTALQSRPYVDMTIDALARFGVSARFEDGMTISVEGGEYKAGEHTVEGDYSNAAFFDAFNLIGGDVRQSGLDKDSLQGDKVYLDYYKKLKSGNPTLDITDCPDLGPVLMAAAALLGGATLTGTARLKIKESDRGECMARELSKFGCVCEVEEDSIRIMKSSLHAPTEESSSHNDHRVAMALSVVASVYGGTIDGAEAVRKSLPDYWEKIEKLGIKLSWNG